MIATDFIYHQGVLYWAVKPAQRVRIGDVAGSLRPDGRWQIRYRGTSCKRSRLIWEYHNGPIPAGQVIDHINRIRSDDRIENLRAVSQDENLQNKSVYKTNTTGVAGVCFAYHKKDGSAVYTARKSVGGKRISKNGTCLNKLREWINA